MVKAFYQSIHYEPLRERKLRRGPPGPNIAFSNADPAARTRLFDHFEEMSIERVGVLRGDYLMHHSGLLLAERNGALTMSSMSQEDIPFAQHLLNEARRPDLGTQINALAEEWDQLPVVDNLPLLCDPYSKNYFHFSLEMAPRLRFYERAEMVIMTPDSLKHPFQRDLATRMMPMKRILPLHWGLRVRDPILAHDSLSEEGIFWLREAARLSARPGARRLYIRRNGGGTRLTPGGGLSETDGFWALLRDFDFETVDFGNGEHDVAAQVAMLDGAGLILSAHGAALTNLAYLHPDIKVIESIGARRPSACFMHLAAVLGFAYHGMFSSTCDEAHDIAVDLDELRDALRALA
jgi:hypothetical protein